jgi:glycogen operon protein
MWGDGVRFSVPHPRPGRRWVRLADTAPWAESAGNCWKPDVGAVMSYEYWVNPYSIVVLTEVV